MATQNPRTKEFHQLKEMFPQLKSETTLYVQVFADQIVITVPDNVLIRVGAKVNNIPNRLWNLLTPGEKFYCWD